MVHNCFIDSLLIESEIGNNGIKLPWILINIPVILVIVASKRRTHGMVSSRGSFIGAEESPGSHSAEMPVVFVPSAKVGSQS